MEEGRGLLGFRKQLKRDMAIIFLRRRGGFNFIYIRATYLRTPIQNSKGRGRERINRLH